jgi:hypothetical protein
MGGATRLPFYKYGGSAARRKPEPAAALEKPAPLR